MSRYTKRRIPQLKFTKTRGIGWHVNYRDPLNGTPRKLSFGMVERSQAFEHYSNWLGDHLKGAPHKSARKLPAKPVADIAVSAAKVQPGSLLHIASGYLYFEERRTRKAGEPRRSGTIQASALGERRFDVKQFLSFINRRYGAGSSGRLSVLDLKMQDIEDYNKELVDAEYSEVLISRRFLVVKAIIDRAGRPEYGEQALTWNWNARDKFRGKPKTPRKLPTLAQLKGVLDKSDARLKAIVWMAIGLGFGQGDLAAVRMGQIDSKGYDLRRGKTGLDRYGDTPPGVWAAIEDYLKEHPRKVGELLFVTRKGEALSHGNTDSIHLWWRRLRKNLGKPGKSLAGFYVLRHLGATDYGSKESCSIGDMRRWLGHSASSSVADVYMRPVAPEYREIIEWVRHKLQGG